MANLVKWNARTSWANAFETADLNALASATSILSTSTAVSNSGGDVYADISFRAAGTCSPSIVGGGLDIYLLPLLDDASTYPDNDSASSTVANYASGGHYVGRIVFRTKATITPAGMLRGVVIPNGTFKFYGVNNCGVALSANNHICKYATYGENLNG